MKGFLRLEFAMLQQFRTSQLVALLALATALIHLHTAGALTGEPSAALLADGTPGKVFSAGPYQVKRGAVRLKERRLILKGKPPKPLRIWAPATSAATSFPVVVFQHGFSSQNIFYSQLLKRIASHGYIVAAPQMYRLTAGYNTAPEMRNAADVIGWLKANLASVLSNRLKVSAKPDWSKFAVSGHSRGGKVAFGVTRALVKASPVTIGAVVLMDPVDGGPENSTQSTPPTLTHSPGSITVAPPVLVIGAGLGPTARREGGMPCAPEYSGHKYFYSDLASTAYHVVMPDYGHADFVNDRRILKRRKGGLCPGGPSRAAMRVATTGVTVAFLKAKLGGGSTDLDDIWVNPDHAPIELSSVEQK